MSAHGEKMVELARADIGKGEHPHGSNRCDAGAWAEAHGGRNGVEWCGDQVSEWASKGSDGRFAIGDGTPVAAHGPTYHEAGKSLDGGVFGVDGVVYGCDHAPTIERWGRGRHRPPWVRWIDPGVENFEPGDILCIAVPHDGEDTLAQHARHVALFTHYDEDGTRVVALAGNVSNVVAEQRWDVDDEKVLGGIRFVVPS